MSEWHNLAEGLALQPGEVSELEWQGSDLLLFRSTDGSYSAVTAYCPHMGNYIPNGLASGQGLADLLEKDELLCPYHGWRFNGDGLCTHIPQGQRVPPAVRMGRPVIRHWQIREHNRQLQISEA